MRSFVLLLLTTLCSAHSYTNPLQHACCLPEGGCVSLSSNQCTQSRHGFYAGHVSDNSSACAAFGTNCPGACCSPSNCRWTPESECCGGVYRGNGTSCLNACTGACCIDDATCKQVNQTDCVGRWQALGTTCKPDGACPAPDSLDIWLAVMILLFTIVAFLFCVIYTCKRSVA